MTTKKNTTRRDAKGRFTKNLNTGYGDIWTPLGGSRSGLFGLGSSDIYGSQPLPTAFDLLNAYEDVVFACVNLITHNVSTVDYRLCATTAAGEHKPKCAVKSLDYATRRRLDKTYRQHTRKALDVHEVTDHPLLDLLDRPNPHQSFQKLLYLTQTYLELVGSAFWYLSRNSLGLVSEIYLLPSQFVQINVDDNGKVVGYTTGNGEDEEVLSPDDVLHVKFINPADPMGYGLSPVRAVWQRVQLLRQEQSSWQAVLSNMAFPSALIFPPQNENFTDDQATRIARQVTERFRMGEQGGVWVVQDNVQYQPVSTPPKDLSALQLYDQIKTSVCNAYGVPRPLLDMQDSNFASADTARRSFQEYCVEPRVKLILEAVNHRLCPPRLFLAADEVIQADRTYMLQHRAQVVSEFQGNVRNMNEARDELGLEPITGGEKFAYQIVTPLFTQTVSDPTSEGETPLTSVTQQTAQDGPAVVPVEDQGGDQPAPADEDQPVQDTALNGAQIASLLMLTDKLVAREYPAEAVVQMILAAFPAMSPDVVRSIVSSLAAAPPPAPAQPVADGPDAKQLRGPDHQDGHQGGVRVKAYRSTMPDPKPLAEVLSKFFGKLGADVSARVKSVPVVDLVTKSFFPVPEWTAQMKKDVSPVLRTYYDQGADAILSQIGGDPATRLHAVQELDKAVDKASFHLADSTLATTTQTIEAAVQQLREAVRGGLAQGEANAQLAGRVKDIFHDLTDRHAFLIAETESSRAKHGGELVAMDAAGVEARKVWLADNMACDICRQFNGKAVDMDKPFGVNGTGPYATIEHPPGHPGCRCTLQYEFPTTAA